MTNPSNLDAPRWEATKRLKCIHPPNPSVIHDVIYCGKVPNHSQKESINSKKYIGEKISLMQLPSAFYTQLFLNLSPRDLVRFSRVGNLANRIVKSYATKLDWSMEFNSTQSLKIYLNKSSMDEIKISKDPSPSSRELNAMITMLPHLQHLHIPLPRHLNHQTIFQISQLRNLVTLKLGPLVEAKQSSSLLLALWSLPKLTQLQLDFGTSLNGDGPKKCKYFGVLVALSRLTHLRLDHLPPTWQTYQSLVLETYHQLKHLHLTFNYPVSQFKPIGYLKKLKSLHLGFLKNCCMKLDHHCHDDDYNIEILPASLENLSIPNATIYPDELAKLVQLVKLDMTPWGWKRSHLSVFRQLPHLQHLRLMTSWLPNAEKTIYYFGKLYSLTLIHKRFRTLDRLCQIEQMSNHQPQFIH